MPETLVCFDLGGVLIRICRTWAEGCRAAGLDVRGDVEAICTSMPAWGTLHRAYQSGAIPLDEYTSGFSELLDGMYTPDEVLAVHEAWMLGEYPDVTAMIARVHAAGHATAALSNTCGDHWRKILGFSSVMALGHRFASHEIGAVKPDAAAFAHVEDATGHAPQEIVFFEDTVENADAARARGWRAEVVDPLESTAPQILAALGL